MQIISEMRIFWIYRSGDEKGMNKKKYASVKQQHTSILGDKNGDRIGDDYYK